MLVASALDPQSTSFPVRATFLPWLAETVSRLAAGGAGELAEGRPGARMPRPRGADALEAPDGVRTPLTGDSLDVPARPGVYFYARGGERRGALVVNGDGGESVLARLSSAALASRFQGRAVDVEAVEARWVSALFAASTRRSLVTPLLVAALLALAAEALAARGARRKRAVVAAPAAPAAASQAAG